MRTANHSGSVSRVTCLPNETTKLEVMRSKKKWSLEQSPCRDRNVFRPFARLSLTALILPLTFIFSQACYSNKWKVKSPNECVQMCKAWNLEFTGMVGVGDQTQAERQGATACICEVKKRTQNEGAPSQSTQPTQPSARDEKESEPRSLSVAQAAAVHLAFQTQGGGITENDSEDFPFCPFPSRTANGNLVCGQ